MGWAERASRVSAPPGDATIRPLNPSIVSTSSAPKISSCFRSGIVEYNGGTGIEASSGGGCSSNVTAANNTIRYNSNYGFNLYWPVGQAYNIQYGSNSFTGNTPGPIGSFSPPPGPSRNKPLPAAVPPAGKRVDELPTPLVFGYAWRYGDRRQFGCRQRLC